MKKWGTVIEIKKMIEEGHTVSHVSRKLKVDRKTVRKYAQMKDDELLNNHQESKTRTKKLDKYKNTIKHKVDEMLKEGHINSESIYEEIKILGYRGSARSLRRYVSRYRDRIKRKNRIYEPFETEPGHQALVDFGEKRKVIIDGEYQVVYFAIMVLGFSRKKYIEWYDRPIDTEMFLQFHEQAFQAFDGIPQEIVYDQTKVAVLADNYGELEFNNAFYNYVRFRKFKTYICKRRDPETKGKVESAVRYFKYGFLLGRKFSSFSDLIHQGDDWLKRVANSKPNETTGRIPDEAWAEEQPKLTQLFKGSYQFEIALRTQHVTKVGLIKVLGNRYSVPSEYQDKEVKVRISEECIEIYSLKKEFLFSHTRYLGKGKTFKEKSHFEKEYKIPTSELTRQLSECYGSFELALKLRRAFPRHYREQCHRLLSLKQKFPRNTLNEAAKIAINNDCVKYSIILSITMKLMKQGDCSAGQAAIPEGIQMPLNMDLEERELSYYSDIWGVSG